MQQSSFNTQLPLNEQIKALKDQIRKAPAAAPLRIYYFQLLCVLGDWSKALEQLQLCAQLAPESAPMARAYREAIRCEVLRAEVFAGRKKPFLMGEPPRWLACMIDALALDAQGQADAAHALRAQALQEAPAVAGEIDGQPFEWLGDSDTRLGPVLELFAQGNYYWLPLQSLRGVGFEKVQDLRDLVWMPCEITLAQGGTLPGFMPARYPLAPEDDDALKLSRRTQWSDMGSEHVAGHGQRTWVTDANDFPMLQVRKLALAQGALNA
nr:type VI secretion system accessory protein TagJ [Delftia sp. PS-11]KAJ8743969.1 virulence protein SciE type [Delftia sp. PS-11]